MFKLPKFNVGSKGREIGTYVAGGLVSIPLRSPLHDRGTD